MTLSHITLEHVRDDWNACYEHDRLAELFPNPLTPYEVLTREDGPWADVPPEDRLWVVLRDEVIPYETQHLLACDFAEAALLREREAGREPDERSWSAIEVARRQLVGAATCEELKAAKSAAWGAEAVLLRAESQSASAKSQSRAARAATVAAFGHADDAAWSARIAAGNREADVARQQVQRVIEVMGWEPREGGAA